VRQAFTKENSSCYAFVNVKFNCVLKVCWDNKNLQGLTLFRNVNHEAVDTVLVTVQHASTGVT